MSSFPSVLLSYTSNNYPTVIIDNATYNSWGDVIAKVKGVVKPENALIIARMLTHFSHRSRYKVVDDPLVYETTYRKRVASEPMAEVSKKPVVRQKSLGIPNFSTIFAPKLSDQQLIFFVYDTALLVPYRVEAEVTEPDITQQKYTLLTLAPS
jgi:hypothetical protein